MNNHAKLFILSLELIDCLDELEQAEYYKGKLKTKALQFKEGLERIVESIDDNVDPNHYERAEAAIRTIRRALKEVLE